MRKRTKQSVDTDHRQLRISIAHAQDGSKCRDVVDKALQLQASVVQKKMMYLLNYIVVRNELNGITGCDTLVVPRLRILVLLDIYSFIILYLIIRPTS